MQFSGWQDGSLLEAASWRLASELSRRHPTTTRLLRTHPGGGQYDCLSLFQATGSDGVIHLNRNGTIQVHQRFDGRPSQRAPTEWDEYFRSDPRQFLLQLEADAGLPAPPAVPPSTPRTLTLRVLAAMLTTAVKSVHPMEVISGWLDTSGYTSGPQRQDFDRFPANPTDLLQPQDDDLLRRPEYRFWFLHRDDAPILAFEQARGLAWTRHHQEAVDLNDLYQESRRHLLVTALKLLRRVDHV